MFAAKSSPVRSPGPALGRPIPARAPLTADRGVTPTPAKRATLPMVSPVPSSTCGLFARSWTPERKLSLVMSAACALFRENGGVTLYANTVTQIQLRQRPDASAARIEASGRVWALLGAHG